MAPYIHNHTYTTHRYISHIRTYTNTHTAHTHISHTHHTYTKTHTSHTHITHTNTHNFLIKRYTVIDEYPPGLFKLSLSRQKIKNNKIILLATLF